jgi:predicted DNA-binding transcriptional regulator YafY
MSEVLLRTLEMLRMIPRGGRFVGAKELQDKLSVAGFAVDIRTIQRDLKDLAKHHGLGIECQEETKPHGYRFAADAPVFEIPAMDVKTALALKLSERFLARVLPRETYERLQGHVSRAEKVLDNVPNNRLALWPKKVRVTSAGLPVQHPTIRADVLDVMTRALLEDRRFRCTYKRRDGEVSERDVNPIALVYRDAYPILVCTLGKKDGVVTIIPHRIQSAELLSTRREVPASFELDRFLRAGGTGFLIDVEPLDLVALVHVKALPTIEELPIAPDQRIEDHDDTRKILRARVANSLELQRWLFGFGDAIEVLEPTELRERLRRIIENLAARYSRASGEYAWAEPENYPARGA